MIPRQQIKLFKEANMNKIIVMLEDEDKELNISLYDFVNEQYRNANPIMVCHVTEKEYKIMLEQIKRGGLLNERLRTPMETLEYNKSRYLLAYNCISRNICIANYEDFEQKGNYVLDSEGLHYDKNGIQFPNNPLVSRVISWNVKIYTTETYEDVISHYKSSNKSSTQISLSNDDIERFEKAYKCLSQSVSPDDYTKNNLKEFRALFAKILTKCDQ